MAEITLFDLAVKPESFCWSLNPWKTRLLLNYKGIDYKTEWLEYPELEPKFKSLGLEPNAKGVAGADYTIPTVIFHSDNKAVMESKAIALEIERRYPNPALSIDTPIQIKVEELLTDAFLKLLPELVPRVSRTLLSPQGREFFDRTKAEKLGMTLDEWEQTKGGPGSWENADEGFKQIVEVLGTKEGPFFDGQQVSFSDFRLVAFLRFAEVLNKPLFNWMIGRYPGFEQLYSACKRWMERDDY